MEHEAYFKRLDLAINDKCGLLNIPELTQKCQQEECISYFKTYKDYKSGELKARDKEEKQMGNTLYIGSLKSEVYFCLYEKDYEQYIKANIPTEESKVKNRFEIRLKNERAELAIRDLLTYKNPERTTFGIINRYLSFVNKVEGKKRSQWEINENWARFIGLNREELRLTMQPEPWTLDKTLKWLTKQVAPTLKMVATLDVIKETDVLNEMVNKSVLSAKHETIIEQESLTLEELMIL